MQKQRSFHFRKIGKHIHHLISDNKHDRDHDGGDDREDRESDNDDVSSETEFPAEKNPGVSMHQQNNSSPACLGGEGAAPAPAPKPRRPQNEVEMIKDRISKLLLGEDMSGAGKGVSSALTLSNAITNLAASVFGEQSTLKPMAEESKARWKREIDWLLAVTDHIVEFAPAKQIGKDGTTMEIMTTRQRVDLLMNVPALRKLDAMLVDTLDNFKGQKEFWYVKKSEEPSNDNDDGPRIVKWWLPAVKVPPDGLSDSARKWMYVQKDSVTQVLKAAMAINAQVLSEMEIPENYIESLPKNGRESLGDSIYKYITEDYFDPGQFLSSVDLSTEHKVLDLKNRIEASIVIWQRKMTNKDSKSSWSSAVSAEKRELFEDRAETILLIIKQKFPGLPQSSLEISKIQYNTDVGQSILESYSRCIESLAHTVMSRIEDVLHADAMARTGNRKSSVEENSGDEMEKYRSDAASSMTLSDFMNWAGSEQEELQVTYLGDYNDYCKENDDKEKEKEHEGKSVHKSKYHPKKSYWDKIESLYAIKSPISRH